MKAVFILAVVTAVVAVAHGAPGNPLRQVVKAATNTVKAKGFSSNDPVIDWARAEVLGNELQNLFKTATQSIVKTAQETDSTAGNKMADIVNKAGSGIDAELTKMLSGIKDQTLSDVQLVKNIGVATVQFSVSHLRIQLRLHLIPEKASESIKATYSNTYDAAVPLTEELLQVFGIIIEE